MTGERAMLRGRLARRYKRFLADVELEDGSLIVVHCPNSGSMKTCAEPGRPVLISDSGNDKRKLRHTLELIHMGEAWVGVNTMKPNRAVEGFVRAGQIPELAGYTEIRREVKYGDGGRSRIDLLLSDAFGGSPDCYVEIKNATMRAGKHGPDDAGEYAAFPDAVTTRGRKHLEDLSREVARGNRAVIFFFIGRADCRRFRPADEIDPEYGRALRRADAAGVEAVAWRMEYSPGGVARPLERVAVEL